MRLEIDSKFKNLRVHIVRGKTLWASSGNTIYRSIDCGKSWEIVTKIPISFPHFIFNRFTVLRRLFRIGISCMKLLHSGKILIFSNGRVYTLLPQKKSLTLVHFLRRGRSPLTSGCCVDAQNQIYYGEYWLNPKREPVYIYKSSDEGRSWEIIYRFPEKTIRHIHAVQYDPYTGYIWVTTGDKDHECQISYSKDGGRTFHPIGSGSQIWRTVSLIFTKDYIYWGTDSPNYDNFIYRWKRSDNTLERLQKVDGPVYYSISLDGLNGQVFLISTGVEKEHKWDPLRFLIKLFVSNDVEEGTGELDHCAHIWGSKDGKEWIDLIKWEKDPLSPFFFGHGRIYFACGQDDEGFFYFTPFALKGKSNCTFRARIILD